MCVLKNNPLTGEPIDFETDPPTCCPDCEIEWEYQKDKFERDRDEKSELYKMQIGHLTGIVNFNNSVIMRLIEV